VPFALRPVNISVTLCRTIILLNNAFQRIWKEAVAAKSRN
jgi:hypothetical protein